MISIIICAREADISPSLKENVQNTIGSNFELVVVDNSENHYSIFSAYNEGIKMAKGDVLCFMHDDILFRTSDWGKKVEAFFREDEKLGLLGIQACCFLPQVPCYWCDSPFVVYKAGEYNSFEDRPILEAVAVDGLWFCVRAELFKQIRFDDVTYTGFHYYDMDICMQVLKSGYKVCVCDIDMEHYRAGPGVNEMFYKNMQVFYEKWKDELPIHRGINEPKLVLDLVGNLMMNKYQNDLLVHKLMNEKKAILNSKAYRIGKIIMKPFSKTKRIIKKSDD